MDYIKAFNNRTERYLYAVNTYPHVLDNELNTAYNMMKIDDSNTIVNIPEAGIDLKKYINQKDIIYHGFEISPDFSKFGFELCDYTNIPLNSNTVDRILVLASFHHVNPTDRKIIYNEFRRILKKGGYLIIGDVIKNSKQDTWLNTFVNKWNSNGHIGIFFNEDDKLLLEKSDFIVDIEKVKYDWIFNNKDEMIDFTINLFGLDLFEKYHNKNDIIIYIQKYLDYFENGNKCGFSWELIYFIALYP